MNHLKNVLQSLYKDQADRILKELKKIIPVDKYPGENVKEKPEWCKNFNLYVAYPNSFCDENKCGYQIRVCSKDIFQSVVDIQNQVGELQFFLSHT